MSIFKKKENTMPEANNSSLSDIIFMLLFFFMSVTTMKEVDMRVKLDLPQATELQKLEKKSLVTYIYVGKPMGKYVSQLGTGTRIQLNDKFAEVNDIRDFIAQEKESMKEEDQPFMTIAIKADKDTKMGIISDIKMALRKAYALKISYAASKRQNSNM